MPPATPERFGDYELVERLGVGGMAETFANDADFVEMFLREARMSALLYHGHIARVLDFAHTADEHGSAAGVIHRDVSPSNVLLSKAGEIKLADFGIAKASKLPGSVASGALEGKIPYAN